MDQVRPLTSEGMKTRDLVDGGEHAQSSNLAARLDCAVMALKGAGFENSSLLARLDGLHELLCHNRLQLAVLGQFKRGKSTFINALLGASLLPTGVVPLTAVPVYISWRSAGLVRVCFSDGRVNQEFAAERPDAIRDFLYGFVAEEANSENHLGVERVDLLYPAPILAAGAVLIDTPGVGSTFRQNTEAAVRALPECDAVLFILSSDPPITEAELGYLRRFQSKAGKILFVLNKADYLQSEDQGQVVAFLRQVLKKTISGLPGMRFSPSRHGTE